MEQITATFKTLAAFVNLHKMVTSGFDFCALITIGISVYTTCFLNGEVSELWEVAISSLFTYAVFLASSYTALLFQIANRQTSEFMWFYVTILLLGFLGTMRSCYIKYYQKRKKEFRDSISYVHLRYGVDYHDLSYTNFTYSIFPVQELENHLDDQRVFGDERKAAAKMWCRNLVTHLKDMDRSARLAKFDAEVYNNNNTNNNDTNINDQNTTNNSNNNTNEPK